MFFVLPSERQLVATTTPSSSWASLQWHRHSCLCAVLTSQSLNFGLKHHLALHVRKSPDLLF